MKRAAPPAPEELARAGDLADAHPEAARAAFKAMEGSPVPDAYLAYFAQRSGADADAACYLDRVRHELPEPAAGMVDAEQYLPPDMVDSKRVSPMFVVLRALRLALEETDRDERGGPVPMACGLFAAHGREALDAFGGMWGSTRDTHGRKMKMTCVHQLVARVLPTEAERVIAALNELLDALPNVMPMPLGTMYYATMYINASDLLRDALLAPEVPLAPSTTSVDAAVAHAEKRHPGVRARLPAYRAKEARAIPLLGDAIAAVLASRGRAADPAVSRALAQDVAQRALVAWLEGGADADEIVLTP